ncbi:MAG: hypothetical protein VW827_07215 [Alphaproteobacteria bacterium]
MWVLKIGGSWITNPKLKTLIGRLEKKKKGKIIIVAGGGCFADSVRFAFKKTKMSEKLANTLALKSTEIFCSYLKNINKKLYLTTDKRFKENSLNVWLPSVILSNEKSFKRNWDSTSDSVAAWLSDNIKADGLVFIKSLKKFEKINKLADLQKKNIIDKNTSIYLKSFKGEIKITGLDILKILEKNNNWESCVKDLGEIKL